MVFFILYTWFSFLTNLTFEFDRDIESNQLIVVVTNSADSIYGQLLRYERNEDNVWSSIGDPIPVVVGRSGLGWGIGMHETIPDSSQLSLKREGDGRSPAGIFSLGRAFGYASNSDYELPYIALEKGMECIDDVESTHYNTIVHRDTVSVVDWKSSEKMREMGEYYEWGIEVNHNIRPVVNGKGSCIFLHIWGNKDKPTAGCTAMDKKHLLEILQWIEPSQNPMLVQLPIESYTDWKSIYNLPTFPHK